MRQIVVLIVYILLTRCCVMGATLPIYINNSPVQVVTPPDVAPQIDATVFVNRSLFDINDIYFTGLPYQTYNTRVFTNTSSGSFAGDIGFRFEYSSGNFRAPMTYWINQGTMSGDTFLLISATNITSTGPILTSDLGLMRLTGSNIKLSGNALRAGASVNASSSGFNFTTNYFDPTGVTDLYWGAGTNNVLGGTGNLMPLNQGNFDVNSFNFGSPIHQVLSYPNFTNSVAVPSFFGSSFGSGFAAFAYTTPLSATSFGVQVVFVPTNSFDTNLSTQVRFAPDFFGGGNGGLDAVVEFSYTDFDIVSRTTTTNYFYFVDHSAFVTNVFLSQNFDVRTKRPNTYELVRSTFQTFGGQSNNVAYDPSLIYNSSYVSNAVPVIYSAYSADIAAIATSTATDPTNYPGRIEIVGNTVNLDQTRIRAETTVIIRATDLTSNQVARVDAPYSVFDITSHQPQMVVSNFAPQAVKRLSGQISAWSAVWQNTQISQGVTNQIQFHALIIDPSLTTIFPASIYQLSLHAPQLIIADPISVTKSIVLDSRSMDVTGSLTLPTGANWANTNIVELYNFTNHGVITVAQTALVGVDRVNPYDTYVNKGTNSAATHLIRSTYLENSGCLVASSGLISIEAGSVRVAGPPPVTNVTTVLDFTNFVFTTVTNVIAAKMQSSSDIGITAGDLTVSNAVFQTGLGGVLTLSVTNSLTDAGPSSRSYWNVGGGFQLLTLPPTGNLLGTSIRSTVPRNTEVFHVWCAEDRGATVAGYSNNVAVGKLTLDAGDFSIISFSAPDTSTQKALYVDYLELLNNATNFNSQIQIDPSLTIYFANANVEASKLDGAANGRIRWVKSFTGPLSSTNYTYAVTNLDGEVVLYTYTLNAAVVGDKNRDDDRDGIVNFDDPTPVYTSASPHLQLLTTKGLPPQLILQWYALAGATNRIEYRTSLSDPVWTPLTNIVPAGLSRTTNVHVFVTQATTGAVERIYRVVVSPPP